MTTDLSQVLSQLPPALIANVVGIFVMLALLLAYFAMIRPALRRRREASAHSAPMGLGLSQQMPVISQAEAGRGGIEEPDFELLTEFATRELSDTRVKLADGGETDARELILVLRDEVSGRLLVMLKDTASSSFDEDAGQRARFTAIMQELSAQTGLAAPKAPAVSTETRPTPPPVDSAPPPRAFSPTLPAGNFDLPKYRDIEDPVKTSGFGRRKIEHKPIPELNIPAAIEAFLQHKLATTGGLPGRRVHVFSAVGGGVRIEVDGQGFESVGDVTDPVIRQYLQDTIAEWQARQ